MCHDSTQCVLNELLCNKVKDCRDGSDEEHCETFDDSKKCHIHQHACDGGRCVDLSVMCDGFDDCFDKSDETNCERSSKSNCGKNMFKCISGTCIAKIWECDGFVDCTDGSDEHDKCVFRDCSTGMHRCKWGQCIDKRLVCDGNNDCGDNSDEQRCTDDKRKFVCGDEVGAFGMPKNFQCQSEPAICLDWTAKCNGTTECPRGEDEVDCHRCRVYEFQCKTSRKCFPIEYHCDGEKDCADGSDEQNCVRNSTYVSACMPGMFDCKDGTCIDYSRVCNGQKECANGQDETENCATACTKGSLCEHKCNATPSGAKCSCFGGYRLDADHKKCSDINECLQGDNPCAQLCYNFAGGYRCSCYNGFMLGPDKNTCKSLESGYSLLYATYNGIRSITESPMTMEVLLLANNSRITSFDLDIARKKLYYISDKNNALYEWSMKKGATTLGLSVNNCSKVAVDWITENVYVVVSRFNTFRLKVCNFEVKFCADIIKLLPGEVMTAIAVDAISRKVFFSTVTTTGSSHICVAGLDGYKYRILITIQAKITDLEADVYKQELYFVDAFSHTLQSMSYRSDNDTSVKTVIRNQNAIVNPSAISIHENRAFIVNTGSNKVFRCHLYGDTGCETLHWNIFKVVDIVVSSPSRQKIVANDCSHKKCAGLCVQGSLSYEYMCQDGSIVDDSFRCPAQPSIEIQTNQLSMREIAEVSSSASTAGTVCGTLFVILLAVGFGFAAYYYYRNRQRQQQFDSLPVEIK